MILVHIHDSDRHTRLKHNVNLRDILTMHGKRVPVIGKTRRLLVSRMFQCKAVTFGERDLDDEGANEACPLVRIDGVTPISEGPANGTGRV